MHNNHVKYFYQYVCFASCVLKNTIVWHKRYVLEHRNEAKSFTKVFIRPMKIDIISANIKTMISANIKTMMRDFLLNQILHGNSSDSNKIGRT